jgi:hypothetical protein
METRGSLLFSQEHPPVHILSQMNLIYIHLPCFTNIRFKFILRSIFMSSGRIFISDFPTETMIAFMCATCPAHFILSDLIILIILGEEYTFLSSLCDFLEAHFISSHRCPNTFLSNLYSNTSAQF